MATAQTGIFAQGTRSHYHLELDAHPDASPSEIANALQKLREPSVTSGGFNLVVGFSHRLWSRIAAPDAQPDDLREFATVAGTDGHSAPATQHDIWIWVHGTGPDLALDAARAIVAALQPVAELAVEQPCFVYRDSRDMTGFIDGTENPPVEDGPGVALIPDGLRGERGAYVITQKWIHDLASFQAMKVPDQEAVIGRTKPDSIELADKPASAHISRVVIEEAGEELEIYRRSTPYGTVGEHGLYFVAFSADPSRYERMLARMFDTAGEGVHDRLTEFSRPVSGAYYFAPSLNDLRELAGPEDG